MTRARLPGAPAQTESDAAGAVSRPVRAGPGNSPAVGQTETSRSALGHPGVAALRVAASPVADTNECSADLLSRRGHVPDGKRRPGPGNAGNRIVPDLPTRSLLPYVMAATLSVVLLLGGCQERLAQRDSYFAPLRGLSVSLHAETEQVLDYHQAMQAALHGCNERPGAASSSLVGSGNAVPEGALDPGAQARLCASSGTTHAAHGAPLNGYRRWVEDRVRELPAPSETASSIGGGS